MAIVGISRDTLTQTVNIVRIVSSDSYQTVFAAGYITSQIANIQALNNGLWEWRSSDQILISYGATLNSNGQYVNGTNAFAQINQSFTSLIPLSFVQSSAPISLNTAAVLAAYATPQLLIAAPGAGLVIVPTFASIYTSVGTSAFAAGGNGIVQYGQTIHGAGTNALSATIPSADITAAASQIYNLNGNTGNALTGISNLGLYFSNATAAFTTGVGSSLNFNINYIIVPASV